jgi:hypothetical protein
MLCLVNEQEVYALANANSDRGSCNYHFTIGPALANSGFIIGDVFLAARHFFITVGRRNFRCSDLKNFSDPRFVKLPRTPINFAFADSWR